MPITEKSVLIVTSELVPFHYGGIGTQFKSLAALLKRHGHQVSFLARKPENYDKGMYRAHYGETPVFFVDTPPVFTWPPQHFVYASEVARRFDAIYPEVRPDLVIFADFNAEGLFLLLRSGSGAYEGTEFLLTTQGMNFEVISVREGGETGAPGIRDFPHIRMLLAMEDLCVHLAPRIVSCSSVTWQEIQRRVGIEKPARTIPNLVDPDLFVPDEPGLREGNREPLILFVGRLDRMKGTDLLLKAYFEIAEQMHPAAPRIIFIGRDCHWNEYGSTFLEHWQSRIPEKYTDAISFPGQVSHDSIRDYLKKASVAVFPSRWEPFGIVCLEALSMGCPVVVSRGTGLEEVLGHELSDFAVPVTEDIQPLEHKIMSLLPSGNGREPGAGSKPAHSVAPEQLRARALEVVRQAEAGWLDLLRDVGHREETPKTGPWSLCGPLHELLASLDDPTWRGSAAHLQLYYRRQGGYTESDSMRMPYSRLCWATMKIPLPGGTGECPLRLDPADSPGITRIREIALLDEGGREIWRTDGSSQFRGCSSGNSANLSIQDSCLVVHGMNNDPQIFLDCPETNRPLNMRVTIYASGE
jgi:glycosyltransferase involved in cell wall biosynthesis